MKRNLYKESYDFFMQIANGKSAKKYLDDNVINKAKAGQIRLVEKVHYIRRRFTLSDLSGIQDMLKDQLTDKVGENTFNGRSLSGMNYFIMNGIKIKYVEAVKATTIVNAPYATTIPASLKATNLIARQVGSDIVNLPFFRITDEYETDDFGFTLDKLEILRANNTDTKLDLEFPSDATILADGAANDAFIEVSFSGYQVAAVA